MAAAGKGAAGTRRVAAKRGTWTAAKREAFLAELSRTCNVSRSAKTVKLSERGAYAARARLPAFREAWADALRAGYQALELKLVERALAAMGEGQADAPAGDGGGDPPAGDPKKKGGKPAAGDQIDSHALRLLAAHRDAAGPAPAGKAKARRSPRAVIEAAIARHEARHDG